MSRWSHPSGIWTWGSTALVAAVLTAPLLATIVLMPAPRSVARLAAASGLLSFSVVVGCASFLYLHWRLTSTTSAAWLTAGMAVVGIHGLAMSGLHLSRNGDDGLSTYAVTSEIVVGLVVLTMARASDRVSMRVDPAAAGLLGGLAVASLHVAVAGAVEQPLGRSLGAETTAVAVGLLVIGALVAVRLARLCDVPAWARRRLGIAVLGLFVSRSLASLPTTSPAVSVLDICTALAGATLLCTTCLAMLRLAIRDERSSIAVLQAQLSDLETVTRADRERLHEVKGTIAGIASASDLINRIEPGGSQRPGLEQMIARETARLNRLLQNDAPPLPELVDLDVLIRPLVVAHRARGHDVRWSPTGHQVVAVADHLSEALNIVLDNAASHAAPGTTRVEVSDDDGHVTLRVCDNGPGVPTKLLESMFEWGTRGDGSRGSGIGLHVAHRLLTQGGHRLELDPTYGRGAAFLLDLGPADLHQVS